jgi:predicted oxidoreductase
MSELHSGTQADVIVVGAGLAGLVSTLELLRSGHTVLLLDRCRPEELGGLAREAFGGMFMVDSREQRRSRIRDSERLALDDWLRVAELDPADRWPRRWAEQYVMRAREDVGDWLRAIGVRFFPVVNWAERGNFSDGNSVPRFHLSWGTGKRLVDAVWTAIENHPRRDALDLRFGARVSELLERDGRLAGCRVAEESAGEYEALASKAVVIAAGGIGGNLELVRREWPTAELGSPPREMLMGSHYYADGAMHEAARRIGANVTHLSRMWNYADAVRHPTPHRARHGVKLIPPRSGVMLDPDGRRYGPVPVMPTFDAYSALERMCKDERCYSWLVCNWKIAKRELDISGSEHNPDLRDRHLVRFLLSVLRGKPKLLSHFLEHSPDFVAANSLAELADKMNAITGEQAIEPQVLATEIGRYDENIARGKSLFNDDQLRRIAQLRSWRGDRLRTCNFQRIVDPKAMPLIAIRLQVMARKSLGGIQTDLGCRVLRAADGEAIEGLYAVGEAAGFGGGGMHGKRSLEGTFLGGCVFTSRLAAAAIAGSELPLRTAPQEADSPGI